MARAFATSVVLLAAGELVAFVFGVAVVFGTADALGLGEGDGAFLAAFAARGTQQARTEMKAAISWDLFFIGMVVRKRL